MRGCYIMVSTNKIITEEKKKALFQYLTICIISTLFGATISLFLGDGALLDMGEQIKKHFLSPFPQNAPLYNFVLSVFYYSLDDLICIAGSFLLTFSIFNYIASDIVLLYQGMNAGLSVAVLIKYSSLFHSISYYYILWFALFRIVALIFYVVYLNTLTNHSFELKSYSANLRAKLDFKILLYLLIFMISGCGFVLLLNAIYCAGIVLI